MLEHVDNYRTSLLSSAYCYAKCRLKRVSLRLRRGCRGVSAAAANSQAHLHTSAAGTWHLQRRPVWLAPTS